MKHTSRGVTLIELMIVVVVVAILASIAVPSYRQFVLRSHRTEARSALLNVAAAQEKFYLQCNEYSTALAGDPAAACDSRGLGFDNATLEYYNISMDAAAETFTIQADAKGGQVADTDCKVMDIDEQGLKRGGSSSSSLTAGGCWD